jgi:septal ring factor EnvC (AmiA/AmiB activator)
VEATVTAARALCLFCSLLVAGLSLAACGHSDEEMMAKQQQIDKLTADLRAAREQIADDDAKFSQIEADVDQLKEQIMRTGLETAPQRPAVSAGASPP